MTDGVEPKFLEASTTTPPPAGVIVDPVDDTSISLGSYREYYRDLPCQIIDPFGCSTSTSAGSISSFSTAAPADPPSFSESLSLRTASKTLSTSQALTSSRTNKRVIVAAAKTRAGVATDKYPRSSGADEEASGTFLLTDSSFSTCTTSPSSSSTMRSSSSSWSPQPVVVQPKETDGDHMSSLEREARPETAEDGDHILVAVRLRPLRPTELVVAPVRKSLRRRSLALSASSTANNHKEQPDDTRAWVILQTDASTEETAGTKGNSSSDPLIIQKGTGRRVMGRNVFAMDRIFEETTHTVEVYEEVGRPIVQAVVSGRHGTIFAYGQTGSGKTYTMQGDLGATGVFDPHDSAVGVVQLAAMDMFHLMEAKSAEREYMLQVQYFEIYNEQCRDLLQPLMSEESAVTTLATGNGHHRTNSDQEASQNVITMRRNPADGEVVVSAHQETVESVEEVCQLLERGNRLRTCGSTSLNQKSSRSHAIFRLTLSSREHDRRGSDASTSTKRMRISVLNLVDLAGSENSTQAGATGLRKREGGKINQSLLSLSRVIQALSLPPKKRPKHIGYRDSKLTLILQPHLSGNACLAVLCCISASPLHVEETRSTLKFATCAKQVQIKPVINEISDDRARLAALQRELQETREALAKMQELVARQSQSPEQSKVTTVIASNLTVAVTSPTDETPQVSDASSEAVFGDGIDDPDEFLIQALPRGSDKDRDKDEPPVEEVVVVLLENNTILVDGKDLDVNYHERWQAAEQRAQFLAQKLEATDDLVETLFHELGLAERRLEELTHRHGRLEERLSSVDERELATAEDMQLMTQQSLVLKVAIIVGLGFFVFGQTEFFLATVLFLWLTLEVVTGD